MLPDLAIGISLVTFGTFVGALGAFFLKVGADKVSNKKDLMTLSKGGIIVLGASLYGISTIPFTYALKFGELSILYPIVSLSYIWAALLAITFLKEKINIYRWVGIAFIMLGVIVISFA